MQIGIVGSGRIGGVVGKRWAQAGHGVLFSSRHPETLASLAQEVGNGARAGSVEEALRFGEVILLSIPYHAVREFGERYAGEIAGKIVLETGNPYAGRDGAVAQEVLASKLGTGIWSARWLAGARLVRAFNSVWDKTLVREVERLENQIGIPLASDDAEAMSIAAQLVRDANYDPVIVGPLASAVRFDVGTPVYNTNMTGGELRGALGL